MFTKFHRSILSLVLLTAGLLLGNASYAATMFPGPINAGFTNPDIIGTALAISYTLGGGGAGINTLAIADTANSTGTFKDVNGVSHPITGLSYTLGSALDDANNNQLLAGNLLITGGILDLGIPDGSGLLAANLTSLGTSWPTTGGTQSGTFQFLGNIVGSNPLLGFGPNLVVTYGANGTLIPEFQANGNFTGLGSADNSAAAIPEPGTLMLLAAGGLALGGFRRRRSV
ncbi:MAG: PEP-CTERM sorting domain-containing protein [Candidatus Competibacteraceae bacterium]